MIYTRLISLTNFVVASSALGFQVFVLYPWHKQLDESFEELKKEHVRVLDAVRDVAKEIDPDSRKGIRNTILGRLVIQLRRHGPNTQLEGTMLLEDPGAMKMTGDLYLHFVGNRFGRPPARDFLFKYHLAVNQRGPTTTPGTTTYITISPIASATRVHIRSCWFPWITSTIHLLNLISCIMTKVGLLSVMVTAVSAQQSAWGQCGGTGWSGETTCVGGYACSSINAYYYQCVPGSTTQQTSTTGATTTGGATTATTTIATTATSAASTTTSAPKTLVSGYYWIRAVESPNYHSYLQAAPTATPSPGPGDAYLLSPDAAGQFNVVDGQLVYYTGGSDLMYMGVENPTNKSQRTLETWFNSTENNYGTFAFQGDTLTWTVEDISRPNTAAWLVCGDEGQLYINTGAYAYETPDGCSDETIHYYGGATADL